MKTKPFAALLLAMSVAATIPTSWAESPPAASNSERYVPQLANIMTAAQLQHLEAVVRRNGSKLAACGL